MSDVIRTVIVDDEPLALKLLAAKLAKIHNIEVVQQCSNGRQALEAVNQHRPDLIFLDIQMPGLSGFDVVKAMQGEISPLVVFTTAYEQYALDAFDANAVDYVLKPIDDEHIKRAVHRAEQRLSVVRSHDKEKLKSAMLGAIEQISDNRKAQSQPPSPVRKNKIIVKNRDEINVLEQSEIEWIDAAGDYICLHVKGETIIKRGTLKELLEELDETIFKRVHRSTIVNVNFIKKVLPHTKGEFFLLLGEYDKLKVSRNYKEVVKDFLSQRSP